MAGVFNRSVSAITDIRAFWPVQGGIPVFRLFGAGGNRLRCFLVCGTTDSGFVAVAHPRCPTHPRGIATSDIFVIGKYQPRIGSVLVGQYFFKG